MRPWSRSPEKLIPLFAWIVVLALLLVGLAEPGFLVDDAVLVDIPQLKAPFGPQLLRALFTWGAHVDYYPIRDLSYWVDIHLFGAPASVMSGTIFRMQNLAWFLASGYLLSGILLELGASRSLAFLSAGLWMLLPMHYESLMWIAARKDVLAIAFCLAFVYSFLRHSRTGGRAWIAGALASFTLGQLSKASFTLLPGALWLGLLAADRDRERRSRSLLIPALAIGLFFSFLQSRFYSQVNDMRYFYSPGYRATASLTALGRMVAGAFLPGVNAIEPENWGAWAGENRAFLPFGVLAWLVAVVAIGRSFRRAPKALPWLLAAAAVYAPVSALFFPHRMFYSIRYIELPFAFAWIAATGWIASRGRAVSSNGRRARFGVACLFAAVLASAAAEARHWRDPVAVFEKARRLSPADPSVARNLFRELSELDRWGRLDERGKAEKTSLLAELRESCGPLSLAGDFRNGHLCEVLWSDEAFAGAVVKPELSLASALGKALGSVSPGKAAYVADRFRLESELRDPTVALPRPGRLVSERLALPERRAAAVLLLCLAGRADEATLRRTLWTRDLLLDDALFFRIRGEWSKRFPERESALRSCR